MTDARVSREHVEVLHANLPDAQVSREHIEVLNDPKPDERLHALRPEALIEDGPPAVRIHSERHEVLYAPTLLSAPDLKTHALRFEALISVPVWTWWDGSVQRPAVLKGWWDGTTVQPVLPARIT